MANTTRRDGGKRIGYGCPPEEHRIKTKQVRNPWGRKGKPRPELDFMDEPFELRFDGKILVVPRSMALDYALFQAALAGNVSAAKELGRRQIDRENRDAVANSNLGDNAPSAEDQAALDRYIKRKAEEQARGKDNAGDEDGEPGFTK